MFDESWGRHAQYIEENEKLRRKIAKLEEKNKKLRKEFGLRKPAERSASIYSITENEKFRDKIKRLKAENASLLKLRQLQLIKKRGAKF